MRLLLGSGASHARDGHGELHGSSRSCEPLRSSPSIGQTASRHRCCSSDVGASRIAQHPRRVGDSNATLRGTCPVGLAERVRKRGQDKRCEVEGGEGFQGSAAFRASISAGWCGWPTETCSLFSPLMVGVLSTYPSTNILSHVFPLHGQWDCQWGIAHGAHWVFSFPIPPKSNYLKRHGDLYTHLGPKLQNNLRK